MVTAISLRELVSVIHTEKGENLLLVKARALIWRLAESMSYQNTEVGNKDVTVEWEQKIGVPRIALH